MKLMIATAFLITSFSSYGSFIESVEGSHKGESMFGEAECEIQIHEVKKGIATFAISYDREYLKSPKISVNRIHQNKFEIYNQSYNQFYSSLTKNLSVKLIEEWSVSGDLSDKGTLESLRIIKKVKDRLCFGWGCVHEVVDLNCNIRKQ